MKRRPKFKCDYPSTSVEYHREYRKYIKEKHPKEYARRQANAKERAARRYRNAQGNKVKYVIIMRLGGECKICGLKVTEHNTCIFDFHHTKEKKIGNISSLILTNNLSDDVLDEINNCVILCANCHRMYHYYN